MSEYVKGKLKKVFGYIEDSKGNVLFHQKDLLIGNRTVKEVWDIVNRIMHTWNNFDKVVKERDTLKKHIREQNFNFNTQADRDRFKIDMLVATCKSALTEWTLHGALTDTARELTQAIKKAE